ncbi:MAG TPA: flagellar biosynthetic protein FliR [Allosphingosinicella sp.]|jgi:flagellar biosynthetic protein FliR
MTAWIYSVLLFSLRVAPVFAFAPPFTLVRTPVLFRVLFAVGIAACVVGSAPVAATAAAAGAGTLATLAVRELLLGAIFVLGFQLSFGALQFAGRTVDVQAGFGMAMLLDPSTRTQMPLVGTILAYAAGAIFFAADGHVELLRILAASLQAIPIGGHDFPTSLEPLLAFVSIVFLTAMGVVGGTVLALFLADLAIALLSRTVPQMNVLVLGFQVKTLLLLVGLPVTLGATGALLARLMRMTVEMVPGLT